MSFTYESIELGKGEEEGEEEGEEGKRGVERAERLN